jgi:plasmid stabilization system protein ParE
MNVIWAREAVVKLIEIERFIAKDNPDRARKFIEYLIDRAESISHNPHIGRIVPEILDKSIREIIAKKYRIIYRIKNERIEILTVFEGHKLLNINQLELQ